MNKFLGIIVLSLCLSISSVFADIEIVSVSSTGSHASEDSSIISISTDGRFVVFAGDSNLVDGNRNGEGSPLIHDRMTGLTERVSVSSSGVQANNSLNLVVFISPSPNLVDGDTNGESDIFVHNRQTGLTERVNVSSSGEQANSYSFPGRLSADGRFVVFASHASNLVDGDSNGLVDVFIRNLETSLTERVSVTSIGEQGDNSSGDGSSISANGRFVAFTSRSSNLVDGDTNSLVDVFTHDRETGIIERVSVSSTGVESNGGSDGSTSISADGRFVAFTSRATNLVEGDTSRAQDVFIHDRQMGITELVSLSLSGEQANGLSISPELSADGRFVVYSSTASNLVEGDTNKLRDVFVHDRITALTKRVSVAANGTQGNRASDGGAIISADGRIVAFSSPADLVDSDTDFDYDVFVTENPLADSNNDLITVEVMINGKARDTLGNAGQLQTGSLYEVSYKVTNNSPDRLTGVQIFEDAELVCDVYALNPGQTKQRSRCKANRTVLSGDNQIQSIVTGKVAGAPTMLTNDTDAYYTGIDNATGMLRLTHRINNINADSESQAPTLDSSQVSVSFKIENTGDIELYRVKTYHDPASPVNSGWDQQCFIGTLKPGQVRYCKRDISLSNSGLNKALGWAQGKRSFVSPTGSINASNPTYFIVP